MPSRRFPYALSYVIGWVGQPCVVIRRRCSDCSSSFGVPFMFSPVSQREREVPDAARLLKFICGADIDAAGDSAQFSNDRNAAA